MNTKLAVITGLLVAALALAVAEAVKIHKLAVQCDALRIEEQIAVATREKIDCEQFTEWMTYKDRKVSDIGIKVLEAELRDGNSGLLELKMKLAIYEGMFASMSNVFRPMATSGVRIRGLVMKPGKTTVRIKCDEPPRDNHQLQICQSVSRSGLMDGEPTQFGFCLLRCDPKRFGETSRIDIIGDDLRIVTFTNENSETYQCTSYKPR